MRAALVVLLVAGTASAAERSREAVLAEANQAYLHGDYRAAIAGYERLVAAGLEHEDLRYNLGNAYFKAEQLGPAIYNYEKALLIDAGQEDAQANLKLTRESVAARWQDKVQGAERDPLWLRMLQPFTLGGLALAMLALYWLAFALAGVAYLSQPGLVRVSTIAVLAFAVLGTVVAGGLLGGRWWVASHMEQAIVLGDELAVKEGAEASYQTSFFVHAGLRVRVVGHDQDWARVRLANGLEGWVRAKDIGVL